MTHSGHARPTGRFPAGRTSGVVHDRAVSSATRRVTMRIVTRISLRGGGAASRRTRRLAVSLVASLSLAASALAGTAVTGIGVSPAEAATTCVSSGGGLVFTCTGSGTDQVTVPAGAVAVEFDLIGGGGGSGWYPGADGGDGAIVSGTYVPTTAWTSGAQVTVTVGGGGAAPGTEVVARAAATPHCSTRPRQELLRRLRSPAVVVAVATDSQPRAVTRGRRRVGRRGRSQRPVRLAPELVLAESRAKAGATATAARVLRAGRSPAALARHGTTQERSAAQARRHRSPWAPALVAAATAEAVAATRRWCRAPRWARVVAAVVVPSSARV